MTVISLDAISGLLEATENELARAMSRFGRFNSPHEGWAVIHEEMTELWQHVIENTGQSEAAKAEAIQVAAMALRYAHDLCTEPQQ